jgi:hypothetical protein
MPGAEGDALAAALFGAVIGAANELGLNLHHVRGKRMTMKQALRRSLIRGATGSLAASAAMSFTRSAGDRPGVRMVAAAVTTVGLSFLITGGIAAVDRQAVAPVQDEG